MLPTRLKKLGIDFPFFVAPMVGVSHVAFRQLIRAYTPAPLQPLLFTEMLSTRRLPSQDPFRDDILRCALGERSLVPQLLGNEEAFIAPSIEKMLRVSPWGFDINMGCPKLKSLSHNWGVQLMGDRHYAADVVRITKKHSPVPVSVKLRAGLGPTVNLAYLDEFTAALEDAGADWLTVHSRAEGAKHSGAARWDVVGDLARRRGIPVVGNGDIQTADDALTFVREYGVDGAMVARAATARPWILWQIGYALGLTTEKPPLTPEEEGREYFHAVLRLSCLLQEYFGDTPEALRRLRVYISLGQRWMFYGHQFWKTTLPARDLIEARDVINDHAEKHPQPMSRRSNT